MTERSADDKRARFQEAHVQKLEAEVERLKLQQLGRLDPAKVKEMHDKQAAEIRRLHAIVVLADRALKSLAPGMPFISFDAMIVNEAMVAVAKEAKRDAGRLE